MRLVQLAGLITLGRQDFPIRKWHEHAREVFSVDWNNIQKELFCTASWDCSIKVVSL